MSIFSELSFLSSRIFFLFAFSLTMLPAAVGLWTGEPCTDYYLLGLLLGIWLSDIVVTVVAMLAALIVGPQGLLAPRGFMEDPFGVDSYSLSTPLVLRILRHAAAAMAGSLLGLGLLWLLPELGIVDRKIQFQGMFDAVKPKGAFWMDKLSCDFFVKR